MIYAQGLIRAAGFAFAATRGRQRGLAVAALLVCPASALAQQATYTGSSTNGPANWCDDNNWDPVGIPVDGTDISIPPQMNVNMALCENSMRILGDITAASPVRFYTPVTFAGDALLVDPTFELSDTPAPIGGEFEISGADAWWRGGIFQGGLIRNSGQLTVDRSFVSGRSSPRTLNSCTLVNTGTVSLLQGFTINAGSTFRNENALTCTASSTIGGQPITGHLENTGTLTVPAGVTLTVASSFETSSIIDCFGTLQLQGHCDLAGYITFGPGGTAVITDNFTSGVDVDGLIVEGDGTLRLNGADVNIFDLDSTAGINGGLGVWFATGSSPFDLSLAHVNINQGALLWGTVGLSGGNGAREEPHIQVFPGAHFNVFSSSGVPGGGDANGLHIRAAGNFNQYDTARIFTGSRLVVPQGGTYVLSHTRMDGDGTSSLDLQGTMEVNPLNDPRTSDCFLNAVNTRFSGDARINVRRNTFITSSSPVELGGQTRITVDRYATWRSLGDVILTDGMPTIAGDGIAELGSGTTLSIRNAELRLEINTSNSNMPPQSQLTQFGNVRNEPGFLGARINNFGNWTWRAGQITLPQGTTPSITNNGRFFADCGSCQFRADLVNYEHVSIIDTLVFAEAGSTLVNHDTVDIYGHAVDATSAGEGRLLNMGGASLNKRGTAASTISTTLDNQGGLWVLEGQLFISGPMVQLLDGALTAGIWGVSNGTLRTPIINVIGSAASAYLGPNGQWPDLRPASNFGFLTLYGERTLETDFDNYGSLNVAGRLIAGGTRRYSQNNGSSDILPGARLESDQPVALNGGRVAGSGTIQTPAIENTGGTVAPGSSPGTLTIEGAYVQGSDAELAIEIAGLTPGTEHDVLAVTGAATLSGTLTVTRLNDYVPALGETFTILTAASLQGAFTTIDAEGFAVTYLTNGVRLTFTGLAPPCDGDVNCDFALDGFDVEVQEKAVGGDMTDYCQSDPDFNGDFALDGFDVEAVEIVVGGGPCP